MSIREWHRLSDDARKAAIEWQTRLSSGHATDAEYEAFSNWIADAPDNFTAYEIVEEFSGHLDALTGADKEVFSGVSSSAVRQATSHNALRRWYARGEIYLTAVAATFLIAIGISFYLHASPHVERSTYAAEANGVRNITLSDGTSITLAPEATVETEYRKQERRVTSLNGRAFFDVASNPQRPFIISLRTSEITVVGTAFEVTSFDDLEAIAVSEGVVSVATPYHEERLHVGERLTVKGDASLSAIETVKPEDVAAWRNGYFQFDDATIADVVLRLNSFYGAPVFEASPETVDLRFSGVLKLSTPTSTARRFSELTGLSVMHQDDQIMFYPSHPISK